MNLGQLLLVGFWGTCVVAFYSLIAYTIFMGVKEFVMNIVKKERV